MCSDRAPAKNKGRSETRLSESSEGERSSGTTKILTDLTLKHEQSTIASPGKRPKHRKTIDEVRPGSRAGFKSDEKLEVGAIAMDNSEHRGGLRFRWRLRSEKINVAAPYRRTNKEAISDYTQVRKAQKGITNDAKRKGV